MLASQALCGAASRRAHRGPALPREAGRGRVSTKQTHVPTSRPELTRQGSRILQKVQTQNSKTISAEAKTSSVCLIQIAKYSHPLCPSPGGSGLGPIHAEKQACSPRPSPHPALPRTEPPNLGLQGGAWVGVANGVRCPRKGRPESPVHPHPWAWLGHNLGNFSAVWVLDCRRPPVQRRGLGSPPRVMLPAREGPCQGLGPLERPSGGGAQPWDRQPRGTCPRPSHFQSPYTLRESRGPSAEGGR